MYEKLISRKLSSFYKKWGFLTTSQFVYWKGLGCTDALRTISDRLQKSVDAGMVYFLVQLDFSSVFD